MKKILFLLLIFCVTFNACTKKKQEKPVVVVENTIKADMKAMEAKNKESFVWLETIILLNNYLNEENDGSFSEVVNVFQAIDGTTFDPKVYKFQHFSNGINLQDSVDGFWIEDYPLEDSLITIPYDSAFVKIMNSNFPKPHSRNVILRNPMGPLETSPQWVFGNIQEQLWLNAKTGEIKNSNPAFPDNFKYVFNW